MANTRNIPGPNIAGYCACEQKIQSVSESLTKLDADIKALKAHAEGSSLNDALRDWKHRQLEIPDDPEPKKKKPGQKARKLKKPKKAANEVGKKKTKAEQLQELSLYLENDIQPRLLALQAEFEERRAELASIENDIQALEAERIRVQMPPDLDRSWSLLLRQLLESRAVMSKLQLDKVHELLLKLAFQFVMEPKQEIRTKGKNHKGTVSAKLRLMGGLNLLTYIGLYGVDQLFVKLSLVRKEDMGKPAAGEAKSIIKISKNTQPLREFRAGEWTAEFRNVPFKSAGEGKPIGQSGPEQVYYLVATLELHTPTPGNQGMTRKKVTDLSSVPIVLTVHPNQVARAQGTILMENRFNNQDSVLAQQDLKKIPYADWVEALSDFMKVKTGRALSRKQREFLGAQYFRHFSGKPGQPGTEAELEEFYRSGYVEWEEFYKANISAFLDRKYSMWDWFYAVYKLIVGYLLPEWQAGLIEGFISKDGAAKLLLERYQLGTFILRFAETLTTNSSSEYGCIWNAGISIAWHGYNDKKKIYGFHDRKSLRKAELNAVPLSNTILKFNDAHFIYVGPDGPDVPKRDRFKWIAQDDSSGYTDVTQGADFGGQPEPEPRSVATQTTSGVSPSCSRPAGSWGQNEGSLPGRVHNASAMAPVMSPSAQLSQMTYSNASCAGYSESLNHVDESWSMDQTESPEPGQYALTTYGHPSTTFSNPASMPETGFPSCGSYGGPPPAFAGVSTTSVRTPQVQISISEQACRFIPSMDVEADSFELEHYYGPNPESQALNYFNLGPTADPASGSSSSSDGFSNGGSPPAGASFLSPPTPNLYSQVQSPHPSPTLSSYPWEQRQVIGGASRAPVVPSISPSYERTLTTTQRSHPMINDMSSLQLDFPNSNGASSWGQHRWNEAGPHWQYNAPSQQ